MIHTRILKGFTVLFSIMFLHVMLPAQENTCNKITVYRPAILANSLVNFTVYLDDKKVGTIANNASLLVHLPENRDYEISVTMGLRGNTYRKRTGKAIQPSCNEMTYCKIKAGALVAENVLEIGNIPPVAATNPENDKEVVLKGNKVQAIVKTNAVTPPPTPTNNASSVIQQSSTPNENYTQPAPTVVPNINAAGKSHALIIAVNEYQDYNINDLDQPIADAENLYHTLLQYYQFEKENVILLKNPTKNEITKMLDHYYDHLTAENDLLIFYAGHGYWDEKFKQGYWLAADAQENNRGSWLSNGTIRDYLRAIPTQHSLLITDACFGGGIFKSRAAFSNSSTAINQLYKLPSRKAMTSGAMSEVPDKSVFVEYLVKRLKQNTDKYLSSEQLFASFKIAVINNSANGQVPQFGEVKETGDEGGDYIFLRK